MPVLPMAVLTPIPATPVGVPAPGAIASGPTCSLQRSGSLWQLGIEAQELTTAIGQLAEQLEADDDTRALALAELEAALRAEEGNKAALAAKADATCWVIEHLRGQAAYRQQQAKRCQATLKTEPLPTPKTEPPLGCSGARSSEWFCPDGSGDFCCSWLL